MSEAFSVGARVPLPNGKTIPMIHLGVYMTTGKECENAVRYALEAGYRGVDSAAWYHNEAEVGRAIRGFLASPANPGLSREDVFFTTKLQTNTSYNVTRKAIKESLRKSGLEKIDLYLLHSPYGGTRKRLECWRAVEDAVLAGEVDSAGVSNFGVRHLKELLGSEPRIKPVVNQIEVHPFNTQIEIVNFCRENSITIEAYAPLVRAMRFSHPTIKSLAKKYDCTPAQLLVRWSLQKGFMTLPKSVKKDRIVSNVDVGRFEIGEADMGTLDGLDEHLITDWDPTDAD
ncbi:hypothetical protein RUND412_009057 [Rhizina undulata]